MQPILSKHSILVAVASRFICLAGCTGVEGETFTRDNVDKVINRRRIEGVDIAERINDPHLWSMLLLDTIVHILSFLTEAVHALDQRGYIA